MTPENFPTYSVEQLPAIALNGISPESMTLDYDNKYIKLKKFKQNLIHGSEAEVFCASTRSSAPVFRFRVGQEIDVINPYVLNFDGEKSRAKCIGATRYQVRGLMFNGYIFQYC